MKKFSELTAADFPGINEKKFKEWKEAVNTSNKNFLIALIVLILINIVLFLLFKTILLGGILFLIVLAVIFNKPNKLFKELGISRSDIKRARSGEKVEVKKTT